MYKAAVLVLSDKGSRGQREDVSGKVICQRLTQYGYQVADYSILPDNYMDITKKLTDLCDNMGVNLVLTTGGTGFAQRDVTPEATMAVCNRMAPGISEAIRAYSMVKTKRAMLSRGVSGIRGKSLIINLPGSPKAVNECMEAFMDVIGHGLGLLAGSEGECGNG